MGNIRDLFTSIGSGYRSIVPPRLEYVMDVQAEYEKLLAEKDAQIVKINAALGQEMVTCQWYISEWKNSQDQFRKKLILTMMQSGKYTYNDVVFYADEIIKELHRTAPTTTPNKNITDIFKDSK